MPGRWELVIFDNDGVLVDSEPIANAVMAGLLTALGHPTTPEESAERYLGSTVGRVRRLVEDAGGAPLPADFEERYQTELFARFDRGLQAVPGVADALAAVAAPTCVASSGTPKRIRRSLALTGLDGHFDGRLFSASEVPRGKPAPDLFLHAAAVMGADPARVAVVEDSPAGVSAARAAGMTVLGYCALTPAAALAGAVATFADMAELPSLLDKLAPGDHGEEADRCRRR